MQGLNLVFVPFCDSLAGERTPDLTTMKGDGFYNRFKYFNQLLTGTVEVGSLHTVTLAKYV